MGASVPGLEEPLVALEGALDLGEAGGDAGHHVGEDRDPEVLHADLGDVVELRLKEEKEETRENK